MDVERDPEVSQDELPNMRGDDVPQAIALANGGTHENNEASSSSSNALSILSATERALQNPLILQNLFQFCPVSTVASCRLVSKQWYDESLTTYRTAFQRTIKMKDEKLFVSRPGKCTCHHFGASPTCICTPLKEFLEFNQNSTKPFRNITLAECRFSLNPFDLDLFWTDIGSNLTTLELHCCYFTSIDELRQVLYKCCPLLQKLYINHCFFPQRASGEKQDDALEYKQPVFGEHKHLKSLWMDIRVVHGINKEEAEFPLSWLELFSHYPSLTSLEIFCGDQSESGFPDPEFEALITAIRNVRKSGKQKLPLKCFSFTPLLTVSSDSASHHRFAVVKELRLPLTEFCIKVSPELDQRFVTSTLGHLAASVNTISMYHRRQRRRDQVEVPTWLRDFPFGLQLNKLTSLCTAGDYFGSFTILKYAPNLASLRISKTSQYLVWTWRRVGISEGNDLPEGVAAYTTTTEVISNSCKQELAGVKMLQLDVLNLDFIISDDDMQRLVNWMPNITCLAMILNDKQFAMVCQNWKNIDRLQVLENRMTAKGFMHQQEGNKATGVGRRPDVANLQGLTYLLVRGVELSKKDVFDLFLHLPNLAYIFHQNDSAERKDLDLSSYQQAIQDNTVELWISNLGSGSLRKGRWSAPKKLRLQERKLRRQ